MEKSVKALIVHDEFVLQKIYRIRKQNVMLDRDLAAMYGVPTKVFKQAVRRHIDRFPDDFMFEMTIEELAEWRSQNVTSKSDRKGLRHPPFCFTEQGVAMLSSVLESQIAIQVNIQVIRVFTRMRQLSLTHKEILEQLEKIESRIAEHDNDIAQIFNCLKQLLTPPTTPRNPIGFK